MSTVMYRGEKELKTSKLIYTNFHVYMHNAYYEPLSEIILDT